MTSAHDAILEESEMYEAKARRGAFLWPYLMGASYPEVCRFTAQAKRQIVYEGAIPQFNPKTEQEEYNIPQSLKSVALTREDVIAVHGLATAAAAYAKLAFYVSAATLAILIAILVVILKAS